MHSLIGLCFGAALCMTGFIHQLRTSEVSQGERYRISISRAADLDPGPGTARHTGKVFTQAYVVLQVYDTTGGRIARLTVDSLSSIVDGVAGLLADRYPPAVAGDYVQTHLVGGRMSGEPIRSRQHLGLQELFQALPLFFSGVPERAMPAAIWIDSLPIARKGPQYLTSGHRVARRFVAAAGPDDVLVRGDVRELWRTDNWQSGHSQTFTGSGTEQVHLTPDGTVKSASSRFQGTGLQPGNGTHHSLVEVDVVLIR